MSKSFLLLPAVLLFAITPTPSSGRMPQEAAPAPAASTAKTAKPTAPALARAKELYGFDCALCHGANGNGKTDLAKDMQLNLADWTDPKSLASKSDKELFDLIRKGKDKMPAEAEGRAKDEEVWALIYYLRAMSKDQPAPAAAPAN